MRALHRNKQKFYYALFVETIESVDASGYHTGEFVNIYTNPTLAKMNISASKGDADVQIFGIEDTYTKIITTDDMSCPIDTDSILWIGITPDVNGESGAVKHNYKVVQVAKSLNSISYAVKEVTVS